jgi:hypothetical protein
LILGLDFAVRKRPDQIVVSGHSRDMRSDPDVLKDLGENI